MCACVRMFLCMHNFWGLFLSNPLGRSIPVGIQTAVTRGRSLQTRFSKAPYSTGLLQHSDKWRSFPGVGAKAMCGWEWPFFVLLGLAGHFCKIGLHPLIGVQQAKLGAKSQIPRLDNFDSCNLRNTRRSISLWHSSYGLLSGSVLGSKQAAALQQ